MSLKFIQNIIYMTVLCCHVHLKFLCIFVIILLGLFLDGDLLFLSLDLRTVMVQQVLRLFGQSIMKKHFFCKIFIYELGQINYIYVSKSFILLEFYYLVKMFTLPKFPFYGGGNGIVYCCLAKKKSNTWNFWYHLGIRIWILLVELLDYCRMVLFSF